VVQVGASATPVEVDGVLGNDEWSAAGTITLPYEVDPAQNRPAAVETTCRVAHDAENLYLGCHARDPDPSSIRAYVTDRDGIEGQDRIVFTLDPFRDARRGFVFGVTALGVQFDALFNQQGRGGTFFGDGDPRQDPSWDTIWKSRGRIVEDGYTVEMAIPFGSLRFPERADDGSWGVLVSRFRPRSRLVELRSTPLDRDQACVLCQAGELRGLSGVRPGSSVQISPTLTASRVDAPGDDGSGLEAGSVDGEPGLNARWNPTSELTLNFTANPDFSQVEADAARLEVNNRFALFFPEKRPFFQEGADVFETPIRALFTRSIVDPVAGAKLTGKLGRSAVGALVAHDRVNRLLLPGSQLSTTTVLDRSVTTAVARLRRDLGASSTLGGLVVAREGEGYHNRVGGVDGFFQPWPSFTARFQYLRSWTAYPVTVVRENDQPASELVDDAFQGQLRYATRKWIVNSDFSREGPDFRADAGFVAQVGTRGGNVSVRRQVWGGSDRWFSRLSAQVGTWRNEETDGDLLDGGLWVGLQYRGPGQLSLNYFPNFFREGFGGREFDMTTHFFNVGFRPWGSVGFRLTGQTGNTLDFANARKADQVLLRPGVDFRVGRRTTLGLSHDFQRLEIPGTGQEIFEANLSEVRAVYNLNTRIFVRAIVQHGWTDRNPEVWSASVPTRSRDLFTQLLVSYEANPQTVVFLGYTDDRSGLTEAPDRRVSLEPRGRTFFLKLGYAWRP